MAYVLEGKRLGDHTIGPGVLETIPVMPTGWTDLAEVRKLGWRWVRAPDGVTAWWDNEKPRQDHCRGGFA